MENGPENEMMRTYPLEGGQNFRDLGGYPAAGGKRVAWGKVFRSGTLAHLTNADQSLLASLDIRFICDLRTNRERDNFPSRWMEEHAAEFWARDDDKSGANLAAVLSGSDADAALMHAMMVDLYMRLPFEQAAAYAELLKRIASGHLPVLFHCSAGKDRTGVLSAILLDILGVGRAAIMEDYVISDDHYDRLYEMLVRDRRLHGIELIDPDRLSPLLRADPDYLTAMFDAIESVHGSTECYAQDVLDLSTEAIGRIRAELLA